MLNSSKMPDALVLMCGFWFSFPKCKNAQFAVMVILDFALAKMAPGGMIILSVLITLEYPQPIKSDLYGAVCQSMLGGLYFLKPSHGVG